ncbi:hypothetical protein Ctob_009719 [Chrysochromulina tobinii]|uniref:Uncharacterized protein n=1 Tax=Chrysochromulina tobinii TaxID=1460289 RepID=A0A0M0JS81_9EUKA|nr:hypothetical protein Ctob_009719 [Chrysochromulina tobinii]|eukprot:KOO29451.1 hypothetical protein Ctob_009719 [Chrysochromulina sp. CCMP291]
MGLDELVDDHLRRLLRVVERVAVVHRLALRSPGERLQDGLHHLRRRLELARVVERVLAPLVDHLAHEWLGREQREPLLLAPLALEARYEVVELRALGARRCVRRGWWHIKGRMQQQTHHFAVVVDLLPRLQLDGPLLVAQLLGVQLLRLEVRTFAGEVHLVVLVADHVDHLAVRCPLGEQTLEHQLLLGRQLQRKQARVLDSLRASREGLNQHLRHLFRALVARGEVNGQVAVALGRAGAFWEGLNECRHHAVSALVHGGEVDGVVAAAILDARAFGVGRDERAHHLLRRLMLHGAVQRQVACDRLDFRTVGVRIDQRLDD